MTKLEDGVVIRRETPADFRETEELVRRSFWNVYQPGCTEHYILHCFRGRSDFVPELDLVMEKDGVLIGQIMYARSSILADDGARIDTLTFGPVCIHPDFRRRGYGRALIDRSIAMAGGLGAGALVIEGDPAYYAKSGFAPWRGRGITYAADSDTDYLLVRELQAGYLDGVRGTFEDPEGYLVAERDPEGFEAYDLQFPPLEKKVLPGQLLA